MALASAHTFVAGENLTAANLNQLNTNILNNPVSLISPLTSALDANDFDLESIDELAFTDATANASFYGRLRRNGTQITFNDGTLARNAVLSTYTGDAWITGTLLASGLVTGAGLTATSNGAITPAAVSGTPAAHGVFRENVVKAWAKLTTAGTGTYFLTDSFNVASIAADGSGPVTLTWDRDFANGNYALAVTGAPHISTGSIPAWMVQSQAVGSAVVAGWRLNGASYVDSANVYVLAVGDQ